MVNSEAGEAERLLAALCVRPRATGTGAEHAARQHCAEWLEASGFATREEEFGYSAFAGRMAAPLCGAILASMFILLAVSGANGETRTALLILIASLGTLTLVGLASRGEMIVSSRTMRSRGVNLLATVKSVAPRVWLVAHIDTKSQPVSILARAAGVTAAILLSVVMMALVGVQFTLSPVPPFAWYLAGGLGLLASIPVIRSTVGNESRGALDNASGVVAVLLAARQLQQRGVSGIGVLITSAEELALAGAHAFCAERPAGVALNCDSVDARGEFFCLGGKRRGKTARAIAAAAELIETPLRSRRMITGILVDSMAFEAREWDCITLCRGDLDSLSRIHTAHDREIEGMGTAIANAAQILSGAASALAEEQ